MVSDILSFKWADYLHFQIVSEIWGEILRDGERQAVGENEVFSIFILK